MTKTTAKENANPYMINGKDWNREQVMEFLCDQIVSSTCSIGTILSKGADGNSLPNYSTVAKWMQDEQKEEARPLSDMYARAKKDQMDFLAEQMIEIHSKAYIQRVDQDGNLVFDKQGNPVMTADRDMVAACRLEAENHKWLMGKLKPRVYGDKIQNEISGPGGGPVSVTPVQWNIQPVTPLSNAEDS